MPSSTAPQARPASAVAPRGTAHVWLPRGLGNAGLLLAVVLDGERWPDAPTATARMLGVSDDSVSRWTDELLQRELIARADGFLVATDAGRERLQRSDALPRALLRHDVAGRTPAIMRSAAVIYGESIGRGANRTYVRSDAERADLAGVHRETLPKARKLLAAHGLVAFDRVTRGRAVLVKAAAVLDKAGKPIGARGSAIAEATRTRLAEAAAKRRATPAKSSRVEVGATPARTDKATPAETVYPIQFPTGTVPIQAVPAAADGSASLHRTDGWPENEPTSPIATASASHRCGGATAAEALRKLLPDLPAATADRDDEQRKQSEAVRQRLRNLTVADIERLRRMPKRQALLQAQAVTGLHEVPGDVGSKLQRLLGDRRQRTADALEAAGRDAQDVLVLALDLANDGKVRSIGATMAKRIGRLANKALAVRDIVTRGRRDWTLQQHLAVLRGDEAAPPAPAHHPADSRRIKAPEGEHTAVRSLKSRIVGAAQAGDWRRLQRFLDEPIAREQPFAVADASNWSGVAERDIETGFASLPTPRQLGRATA